VVIRPAVRVDDLALGLLLWLHDVLAFFAQRAAAGKIAAR